MNSDETHAPPLSQVVERCENAFALRYGSKPMWISAAPGRVNIIGEHTDYNGGFVLPAAIDRRTIVAAAPNNLRALRLFSASLQREDTIDLQAGVEPIPNAWSNYIRGVARGFQMLDARIPGLDLLIDSNVPLGGGLSSSAALEVATATLLEAVTGQLITPMQKVLLCQKAEHDFAGVPCGIMDQMASAVSREGHLLLLDCRSLETAFVPFQDPAISILIVNTRVRHELTGGEYAQRRASCNQAAAALGVEFLRESTLEQLNACRSNLDPVAWQRARHVVTENSRTFQAREAIQNRRWAEAGALMYASHASLRDDFAVSCRELDTVVEIAQSMGEHGGVYGCRMTGGGFGGCAVALIQSAAQKEIVLRMRAAYQAATATAPSLYVTPPAAGAALVKKPGA